MNRPRGGWNVGKDPSQWCKDFEDMKRALAEALFPGEELECVAIPGIKPKYSEDSDAIDEGQKQESD